MNKKIKVSLDDVLNDDLTNPFWSQLMSSPNYKKFEEDIDYIMGQSAKHNKPFANINKEDLDPYNFKLK